VAFDLCGYFDRWLRFKESFNSGGQRRATKAPTSSPTIGPQFLTKAECQPGPLAMQTSFSQPCVFACAGGYVVPTPTPPNTTASKPWTCLGCPKSHYSNSSGANAPIHCHFRPTEPSFLQG
jgi:hypothetical protein